MLVCVVLEVVEEVEAQEQRTLRRHRLEKQLNTLWRIPGGNKMYATIAEGMIKLKLRTIREKHTGHSSLGKRVYGRPSSPATRPRSHTLAAVNVYIRRFLLPLSSLK